MAWVPSPGHHCHCLLYKMMRKKDYYGFGKLHQELSCACAYWESPLPRTPFFSLNIYIHFNTFWFQEECTSIISSAALILGRHLFCCLSTQLTSAQEVGSSPTGAHSFTSLSFNWIVSQEAPSKLTLSHKCETLLPETSSYCLKLFLKLSRERHTFQGIWGIWLQKWDRSFRPTAGLHIYPRS